MKSVATFIISLFFVAPILGQSPVLDSYIAEGLEKNLALRQKLLAYEKSRSELSEAKGMYYPDISFNARYSVAEGGRTIEFPVGDLLNPVYQTLNSITESQRFPMIANEEFYFFRPTEQVTQLQLVQPIFNPQIYFNKRIKSDLMLVKENDMKAYQRFLVAEIKSAYYNYLKTEEILDLYEQTREVLEENIRVNRKLFENDKVTIDNVYRSEAELSNLDQKIAEAGKFNQTAKAYFNFLLNRDLEQEIVVEIPVFNLNEIPGLTEVINRAKVQREELLSLRTYQDVTSSVEKMNRSNRIPKLFGSVDYGVQGVDYNIDSNSDFLLASFVLQWELFTGLQNNERIQQAQIDQKAAALKLSESEQQISLEVIEAYYDLQASFERIEANNDELTAARKAFQIIQKKYNEGQASLLEFIDARTSMTNAEQNLILTKYDHLIKFTKLERSACLYPLSD